MKRLFVKIYRMKRDILDWLKPPIELVDYKKSITYNSCVSSTTWPNGRVFKYPCGGTQQQVKDCVQLWNYLH